MTAFILIAIIITIIAFFLLVFPLIRTRNTISYERHAQNIHYARERLQELEEQLKNATISATDYEALKLEIETTLAHDIDLASRTKLNQTVPAKRSNKLLISLLGVCLPVSALGFYLLTGTPEALDKTNAETQLSSEQVDQMILDIEEQLRKDPNNLRGWTLLSKTYLSLGRFEDARNGYLKVLELEGESASTYAALADATALMSGGEINSEASTYIQKALSLDANSQQALWLAGLGAVQNGANEIAQKHWNKLIGLLEGFPEQQNELRSIMQSTFADELELHTPQTKEPSTNAITIHVELAKGLTQQVNASDVVFVFARAAGGPPAPLAVKRITVDALPTTITLSDADAMMSQMTLSKFEDVVVSARISKSGNPIAQTGDIQSQALKTKNNTDDTINLVISDVVK